MKTVLLSLFMLLAVCDIQADGLFRVNGEDIKKTPTTITLDNSKVGYLQVTFSDHTVVSYNMNLIEFYPNGVTSIQKPAKEGGFFHIKGHVRDVLYLEGITPKAEVGIYSADGAQKYRGKSNSKSMSIDVSRLSRGVYLLRVDRQAVKFFKE